MECEDRASGAAGPYEAGYAERDRFDFGGKTMVSARFILCERTGKWAVAFRRQVRDKRLRIYETRSLDQCWDELSQAPWSIVGVEVTVANMSQVAIWLEQLRHERPRARAVLLGQRGLEPAEWLLRQAAAAHVVYSPRDLQPVLDMVDRHLSRESQSSRDVEQSV